MKKNKIIFAIAVISFGAISLAFLGYDMGPQKTEEVPAKAKPEKQIKKQTEKRVTKKNNMKGKGKSRPRGDRKRKPPLF